MHSECGGCAECRVAVWVGCRRKGGQGLEYGVRRGRWDLRVLQHLLMFSTQLEIRIKLTPLGFRQRLGLGCATPGRRAARASAAASRIYMPVSFHDGVCCACEKYQVKKQNLPVNVESIRLSSPLRIPLHVSSHRIGQQATKSENAIRQVECRRMARSRRQAASRRHRYRD